MDIGIILLLEPCQEQAVVANTLWVERDELKTSCQSKAMRESDKL